MFNSHWTSRDRALTTQRRASFEGFTSEVDLLVKDSHGAEATSQPHEVEEIMADAAPWVNSHLPRDFIDFDDLVTSTVCEASLDDW
jgi:hypothetical protein